MAKGMTKGDVPLCLTFPFCLAIKTIIVSAALSIMIFKALDRVS